jgi:molybdenum cofactor cytidylyltransferase
MRMAPGCVADSPAFLCDIGQMFDTPILILAAGRSSRMRGRDKLAEVVEGEPLLTRITKAARAVSPRVFVALPAADHPRLSLISGLDVTPLILPESAEGMSGTLRGGIAALPVSARFMVLLSDLPGLTAPDLAAVLAAPESAPDALIWRGATVDGRPGHPILFDAKLRPRFAELSGDGGGEVIVNSYRDKTCLIALPDDRARLDLDTPEDWAAWRALRGE